jgi:hypothetical protein
MPRMPVALPAAPSGPAILLSVSTVARKFAVSETLVRQWMAAGKLAPDYMSSTGASLFRPETVESFARTRAPRPPAER